MGQNSASEWLDDDPALAVRQLLDDVLRGRIVSIAATVHYTNGDVRYVPIGQAPNPLAGALGQHNTRPAIETTRREPCVIALP